MLSWWFLLPCLLVSGLAAYLFLHSTRVGDYPWAHYSLTVALAPILLAGVYAGAIALSGAVFDFLETPQPASHSPATNQHTQPESTREVTQPPETTLQKTTPEDVAGSSSPSASPSASPTAASPTAPSTASPSAAPSASPAASASATASASSASPSP